MSLKAELLAILKNYSFIHIDTVGELSILVPLTGASPISSDFTFDSDNPVSLYLFGDNTCKSDLERVNFFRTNNSFEDQFEALINELTMLKNQERCSDGDNQIIELLITELNEHKPKADSFSRGNPGLARMSADLNKSDAFVVKGEFHVVGYTDGARYLDLPNIWHTLEVNSHLNKKMMAIDDKEQYLVYLSSIADNRKTIDLKSIIKKMIEQDHAREDLVDNPALFFAAIYKQVHDVYPSLSNFDSAFFATLAENFSYLHSPGERFTEWPDPELIEAIISVFNQAKIISAAELEAVNSFAQIYHSSRAELLKNISNDNEEEKLKSYQLFVLQTFLFLCTAHVRLKNPEHVKEFLLGLSNDVLIVALCTDEEGFKERLHNDFDISPNHYQSIIDATHKITLAHLEAPHFDELRIACMPLILSQKHYLVIGGRLCWSTALITEQGNIERPVQQQNILSTHFETFYSQKEQALERLLVLEFLHESLKNGPEYEAIALDSLTHNLELFSEPERQKLLKIAIVYKKLECVQFLIEHGVTSDKLFQILLAQIPINTALLEQFIIVNPHYLNAIDAEDLTSAASEDELEKVRFILKHKPELLECQDSMEQTPFLCACASGAVDVVDFLMNIGADILAVKEPSSARQLALKTYGARELNELFEHYPQRLREKLALDAEYRQTFLSNEDYISRAISQGEFRLAEGLLHDYPEWAHSIKGEDFIEAIDDDSYEAVDLILDKRPELLEYLYEEDNQTPFIRACEQGNIAIIRRLLDAGADIFATKIVNHAPLEPEPSTSDCPFTRRVMDLFNKMLKKYHFSKESGVFLARNLVRKLPENEQMAIWSLFSEYYEQIDRNSPLHKQLFNLENVINAIKHQDYELADIIFTRHPEFRESIPSDCLYEAIESKELAQVQYILNHNPALLEYRNDSQHTPFLWACKMRNQQIMEYLMDRGANVHAVRPLSAALNVESYSGFLRETAKQLVAPQPQESEIYFSYSATQCIKRINSLLDNYAEQLESKLSRNRDYKHRFTVDHIIKAIDARDLKLVELFLHYCPHLQAQLSPEDTKHIKQQRYQARLSAEFENLLAPLETKRKQLSSSFNWSAYIAINELEQQLNMAKKDFSSCHLSEQSIRKFEFDCNQALDIARSTLAIHRGWHGYHIFARAVLGLLATITVIPALIVHAVTTKGYLGTFFACPETDSAKCLNQINTDLYDIQHRSERLI